MRNYCKKATKSRKKPACLGILRKFCVKKALPERLYIQNTLSALRIPPYRWFCHISSVILEPTTCSFVSRETNGFSPSNLLNFGFWASKCSIQAIKPCFQAILQQYVRKQMPCITHFPTLKSFHRPFSYYSTHLLITARILILKPNFGSVLHASNAYGYKKECFT